MRQIIDNFRPLRLSIALILMIFSFFYGGIGHIYQIYTTALLGSLFFFNIFTSYFVVAPILTIISSMIVFGNQIGSQFDGTQNDDYIVLDLTLMFLMLIIGLVSMGVKHIKLLYTLKKYPEISNSLSNDKLYFNDEKLRESNLPANDLAFFKSKMRKYYQNYRYLQSVKDTMEHKVDSYDTDLTIIHAIFNELVASPRMLLKMDSFLYSHLKDYVDKVKAIIDLDDNVIKSDEDLKLLEDAKKDLATLSRQFRDDFIQVTEDERDTLKK